MDREMRVDEVLEKYFGEELQKIADSKTLTKTEFNNIYGDGSAMRGVIDRYRKNVIICDKIPFIALAWLSNKGVLDNVTFNSGDAHIYGTLKGVV